MRRLAAVTACVLAGCVTTPSGAGDDLSFAHAVVIPLGQEIPIGEAPLVGFYQGLLERLQDAYGNRNLAELRQLLAGYSRTAAPAWARASMDSFGPAASGLAFELHCDAFARLLGGDGPGVIGAPLRWQLRIEPTPDGDVVLGGAGDAEPTAFGVYFAVADTFVDGATREQTVRDRLLLPAAQTLGSDRPLLQPIEFAADATPAVRRHIDLVVELLPGYVRIAGERVPVRRTELARASVDLFPAGAEAIRSQPLATLREAQRLGDAAHLPHVFLAALFAPAADRAAVEELLIQWVRLGRDDQAVVAMAALRATTGAEIAVGDRQAWLAWWQGRR